MAEHQGIIIKRDEAAKCWLVTFDASNVFSMMAGGTYPMPFTLDASSSMVAADLYRRFPGATVYVAPTDAN